MNDQTAPDLTGSFLRSPHGSISDSDRFACPCGTNLLYAPVMADHLRNCAVFRNDVTARRCPALMPGDNSTHHLVARRVGEIRNQTLYEHVCHGCGQKAAALRTDSAIESAILLIMDTIERKSGRST